MACTHTREPPASTDDSTTITTTTTTNNNNNNNHNKPPTPPQVYRATLTTGEVVAVKVQRPDVLQSVTLDLYVIRLILLFIAKNDSTRESALSILGVIDNWADRFLQELDYLQEAANGDRLVLVGGVRRPAGVVFLCRGLLPACLLA